MREMPIECMGQLGALAERVLAEIAPLRGAKRRAGATASATASGRRAEATVLALHGELGAGKTAFVQALARVLGISAPVPSPTFVIMRRYAVPAPSRFSSLVHIDAYRLESRAELAVIGFDELLADPRALLCIEWAERIAEAMPKDALHLTFSHRDAEGSGTSRRVLYGYENETNEKSQNIGCESQRQAARAS